MNHYINTAATDLSQARNASLLTPTQPRPFPVLAYGNDAEHRFYFHNNGTAEPWSGDPSNGLRVTLGDVNLGPTDGTFVLNYGGNTLPTDCPPTAGDIENALNGLAAIVAAGNCAVTGAYPNFAVTLLNVGVPVYSLTADATKLVPTGSIAVTNLQTGDASHAQRWALTFRQNAIDSTTTWTPIANGWSGTLTTDTTAALWLLITQGQTVGDFVQVETIITVERIAPDSSTQAFYQASVIIRAKNSDLGAAGAPSFDTYVTSTLFASNGVQNRSGIVGLASAVEDATKLGGTAAGTSGLPVGAVVACNFAVTVNDGAGTHAGTMTMIFQVQTSTSSSAPFWVRPWNYDAGTNAVAYRLLGVFLDTLPAAYNATTGRFHYLGVSGATNAVFQFADQVGTAAPA